MKQFCVDASVFEQLPHYCIGIVTAKGFDNRREIPVVSDMLRQAAEGFCNDFRTENIREIPGVKACRDAFLALGMNPNKFMCSIEALMKRVQKNGVLPSINPVVDLGNAFSLKYQLPLGAHDIDKMEGVFSIRFSTPEDHFQPMGGDEIEAMPSGELIYVSGHTVKTRRWVWRQSEDGKITENSSHIFFPIDGFTDVNGGQVLQARDALADFLQKELGCDVSVGYVDCDQQSFTIQ